MFPKHRECMRSSASWIPPRSYHLPLPSQVSQSPLPHGIWLPISSPLGSSTLGLCPSAWAQPTHRGQGQFHPDCSSPAQGEQKRLGGKWDNSVLCAWRGAAGPGSLWPQVRKAMGTSLPQPPPALSLTLHHRLQTRADLNRFSRKGRPKHSLQETARVLLSIDL